MRASPAFQVSLHRFGVWRGAVLVVAVCVVAALAAWLITRERPVGAAVPIMVTLAGGVLVRLACSLGTVPAVNLRWDGQLWHLGRPGSMPDEAVPGDLTVAIDLGPWMLLRFKSFAAVDHRPQVTWLPVQRRGIEARWHALRCSVYSPRPSPGADPATGL